jgi:hypothetical protein
VNTYWSGGKTAAELQEKREILERFHAALQRLEDRKKEEAIREMLVEPKNQSYPRPQFVSVEPSTMNLPVIPDFRIMLDEMARVTAAKERLALESLNKLIGMVSPETKAAAKAMNDLAEGEAEVKLGKFVSTKDPRYTGYVDFDGNPITMDEWTRLMQRRSTDDVYGRVGRTQVTDDIWVSTVWLGMDHNFGTDPPLYYETMVFGGKGDERQDRYTTLNAAQGGHTRVVEWVKALEGLGD